MDRAGDGRSVMHEMRSSGLVCVSSVCARERREAAGTVCVLFSHYLLHASVRVLCGVPVRACGV